VGVRKERRAVDRIKGVAAVTKITVHFNLALLSQYRFDLGLPQHAQHLADLGP
jgi:hypothetical protein